MSAVLKALPQQEIDHFAPAQCLFDELIAYLGSPQSRGMKHEEAESLLQERGRELLRTAYQGYLDSRGPGPAAEPVCGADGIERTVRRLHTRRLSTVFGEVQVSRFGYGAPEAESLHPLDAELNLPDKEYSHGVRRLAATHAAKVSFDDTVQNVAEHTGKTMGKRQIEELAQRASVDFDGFYAQRTPDNAQPSSDILVISADGKGIVMRHEDLREATRKAAEKKSSKLDKRLSKGEKKNRKRMSTVAAVYTVGPHQRTPDEVAGKLAPVHEVSAKPPKVENKRVWASLEKTPEEVIREAFAEGLRRDPERKKTWVGLVDGNAKQLEVLERLAAEYQVKMTIVMDAIHVVEYLWKASTAFYEETSPQREKWVSERFLKILNGEAAQVAAGMRRSATLRDLSDKQRAPVEAAAGYLLKHQQYMEYHRYLKDGLPIATGVIEGACRHLVCDRMDGPARWSLKGAEAVLRLRALRCSGDFDQYWEYHMIHEYQRAHASRYENGRAVSINGRSRPALSVVE